MLGIPLNYCFMRKWLEVGVYRLSCLASSATILPPLFQGGAGFIRERYRISCLRKEWVFTLISLRAAMELSSTIFVSYAAEAQQGFPAIMESCIWAVTATATSQSTVVIKCP